MSEWEPKEVVVAEPRRWGPFLAIVLLIGAAVAGVWFFRDRIAPSEQMPMTAPAEHVRSDVSSDGDSLDIIVSWDLGEAGRAGLADSVRIEVGVEGTDPRVDLLPGRWRADTLRIPAPAPGTTSMGHSCVWAVRGSRLSREACTPWQFVRPAVEAERPPKRERADGPAKKSKQAAVSTDSPQILRIVIRPSGRQVDPDAGGKCASWQGSHPDSSVWLTVNETAVADCMGPNGKPTVAQFCAFAVLQDGSRVKTENSVNNPYCDELFQTWTRERVS